MPPVFLSPALSLAVDPALFPLLFRAFGAPPALGRMKHPDAGTIARLLWGGDGPYALAEGAQLLTVFGHPAAREGFREAAVDARARGHFDDGLIDRALDAVGAPVSAWGTMRAVDLALQTLAPLKAAILGLLKIVDDTMLSANGQAWDSGTALYTVLRRVKGTDGGLEADLAPLSAFFKRARKPSAKNGAPKPTTTTPAGGGASVHAAGPVTGTAPSGNAVASSGAPAGVSTTHA